MDPKHRALKKFVSRLVINSESLIKRYRCNQFKALTYFDAVHDCQSFKTTSRKYLEKCLEQIAIKEHEVKAFVTLKIETGRQQADESTQRWLEGRQLSIIDGMPIGIKDLIETFDMPTQMGCEAYNGYSPGNDNALVWALREAGCIIIGKTVTAELGGAHPGPTKTPLTSHEPPVGHPPDLQQQLLQVWFPSQLVTSRWFHNTSRRLLRKFCHKTQPRRASSRRTTDNFHEYAWSTCGLN